MRTLYELTPADAAIQPPSSHSGSMNYQEREDNPHYRDVRVFALAPPLGERAVYMPPERRRKYMRLLAMWGVEG